MLTSPAATFFNLVIITQIEFLMGTRPSRRYATRIAVFGFPLIGFISGSLTYALLAQSQSLISIINEPTLYGTFKLGAAAVFSIGICTIDSTTRTRQVISSISLCSVVPYKTRRVIYILSSSAICSVSSFFIFGLVIAHSGLISSDALLTSLFFYRPGSPHQSHALSQPKSIFLLGPSLLQSLRLGIGRFCS